MSVSRRQVRVSLSLVIVAIAAVAVSISAVSLASAFTTKASPSRYLSYVGHHATGWRSSGRPGRPQRDQAWIASHRDAVLAIGRRACRWLAQRADVPDIDPSGRSEPSALALRYARSHADGPIAALTRFGVAVGAWNHLCADLMNAKTSPPSSDYD